MKSRPPATKNIDEYIACFPEDVQDILQMIRAAVKNAAPQAEETISYQIPAFTINGKAFIYFAAFKKHISVYPAPRKAKEFKEELAGYSGGKGTVQFPLDKPIPFALVTRITKYRATEALAKSAAKQKRG